MKVIGYLKSQFEIIKIQIIIFNTQDNCSDRARLVFSLVRRQAAKLFKDKFSFAPLREIIFMDY